ncbi:MAG: hypothetical protein IPM81_20510 [Saprospirales bacterium]|nr:hypothetical protein [Saprospirales bacterium]
MAKKTTSAIAFDLCEISFRRTSNVFLNTGIVALYDYLDRFRADLPELKFELTADALIVQGEGLLERLEWIYYRMGNEVYDTVTEKQMQELGNAYYLENEDRFVRFPKISTLGLTELLTNNSQGLTPKEENQTKLEKLKKDRPEVAAKFEAFFKDSGLDLAKNVYLNEPYTKITRLTKPEPAFFQPGENICDLTGEGFKKLEASTSTSPFLSGISNFNSYLTTSDKKISWKAMYLSRFAPKYCFYRYAGGMDAIFCYLFETDDLLNLQTLIQRNISMFMDGHQLLAAKYLANFKFVKFGSKKGDEERTADSKDFVEPDENLFMLIFTIYRNLLMSRGLETGEELEFDIFTETLGQKYIPLSLVSFRADKFASTMRPTAFEQFNHFKFTVRLMAYLEKQAGGFFFQNLIRSLLFKERSDRSANDSYRRERRLRNTVLSKLMHQKSILADLEVFFFKCFLYLNSSDEKDKSEAAWKDFYTLFQLAKFYEPIIQRRNMDKEKVKNLQERAVKLGYSIGMSVLEFDGNKPDVNAKQARAYMVHLHKARTAEQFREAIIRFQKKYGIIVANDLLEAEDMNDDQSFVFIKQFTVMAALNSLNGALKSKKSDNQPSTAQPAS